MGFYGSNIVLQLGKSASFMETLLKTCSLWCGLWELTENHAKFLVCPRQFCLWIMNCATSRPGCALMHVQFFVLLWGSFSCAPDSSLIEYISCWLPKAMSVKCDGAVAYLLSCKNSRKIGKLSWVLSLHFSLTKMLVFYLYVFNPTSFHFAIKAMLVIRKADAVSIQFKSLKRDCIILSS